MQTRRTPGRLTPDDVGAWLVKSRVPATAVLPGWRPGTMLRLSRCLHPTYRVGLMTAGNACVLWVSGPRDPGVAAVGVVAEAPHPIEGADRLTWEVDLRLWRLPEPVPRAAIAADPGLAGAEVLRMPAGSNPSYLSPAARDRLAELIDPDVRVAVGGPWVR